MSGDDQRNEVMWCTVCGVRLTEEEVKGHWGCPKCGNQGTPCGCDGDVRVEVNWHELRILTIWSENWARWMKDKSDDPNRDTAASVVTAIARRLQRQHPDQPPLTLSQEIAELPAALDKAGIKHSGIQTNVPRPEPVPVNGPGAVGHSRRGPTL